MSDIKVKRIILKGIRFLKDNESICTGCDKKINDDVETKWNLDAEPYCRECFEDETLGGEK